MNTWFEAKLSLESPVMVSIPHSGRGIHPLRKELDDLPKEVLLRDVDWAVDEFWVEPCVKNQISYVKALTHRYVIDLNRSDKDVHSKVLVGGPDWKTLKQPQKVLFWYETTWGEPLGPKGQDFVPLSQKTYETLLSDIWRPYYETIESHLQALKEKFGYAILIDAHSMPSEGTQFHLDSGRKRADLVPGDLDGKSCSPKLTDLFEKIGLQAGLSVQRNDPYKGGYITQHFGRVSEKIHALQIEVNRTVYMDEGTKKLHPDGVKRLVDMVNLYLQALVQVRL